ALPMGDTVGQVFADDRDAVTNGPHDGFGQPLSCSRWHVADPVTFRLLRWSGAGECRQQLRPPRQGSGVVRQRRAHRMGGGRDTALAIAPSGSLAWAFALWPFGAGACAAGAVCGAVAGVFGARPLAWLADRASAEGRIRRWSATAAVLVAL